MQDSSEPRPGCTAQYCSQHNASEDAAEMLAFENLGRDRAHHGSQAVAERALGNNHCIQHYHGGRAAQPQKGKAPKNKTAVANHPHPLASDPIGQMANAIWPGTATKLTIPKTQAA